MRLDDVRTNYDRLAPVYDLLDRWLSRPLTGIDRLRDRKLRADRRGRSRNELRAKRGRFRTVRCLSLGPGDRALDIGCGTGLNLSRLVGAVGPTGRVVAVDYSAGMLQKARQRVEEQGWDNVELVQGDAAVLEGVQGRFDGVTSTWALGIVEDLPAALRRAVDAVRPGGRLAILDLHRTRAPGGLRRYVVDPLLHVFLRCTGVDSPEDLDEERLWRRWQAGRAYLRDRLRDVHEQTNVGGTGFLLWGTAPSTRDCPSEPGLEP